MSKVDLQREIFKIVALKDGRNNFVFIEGPKKRNKTFLKFLFKEKLISKNISSIVFFDLFY